MHELTLTNKKCVIKKNTLFIDNLVANFSNLVSISDLGSIIKKNVYSKMYFKCTKFMPSMLQIHLHMCLIKI